MVLVILFKIQENKCLPIAIVQIFMFQTLFSDNLMLTYTYIHTKAK